MVVEVGFDLVGHVVLVCFAHQGLLDSVFDTGHGVAKLEGEREREREFRNRPIDPDRSRNTTGKVSFYGNSLLQKRVVLFGFPLVGWGRGWGMRRGCVEKKKWKIKQREIWRADDEQVLYVMVFYFILFMLLVFYSRSTIILSHSFPLFI